MRGHEHRLASAVEPPHVRVHQAPEARGAAQDRGVVAEIGMKAADERQVLTGAEVSRGETDGPRRRHVHEPYAVGRELASQPSDARDVHAHVAVERDRQAERADREVLRLVDLEIGCRVDADPQVPRRMPKQRLQRRGDAVGLVEVVVGDDRDAHHAASGSLIDGRSTRSRRRLRLNRSSRMKCPSATASGTAISGRPSRPPASTACRRQSPGRATS